MTDDGHCSLCHALNEMFEDGGLADGCCCCLVHKKHGCKFPPEPLTPGGWLW